MSIATLVVTELESTWPQSGPILFLGEWCKLYSRKEKWCSLDARVVNYHWNDRQKLKNDFYYLQDIQSKILTFLETNCGLLAK